MNQHGFAQLYGLVFVLAVVAGGWIWLHSILHENKQLRDENLTLLRNNTVLKAEAEIDARLDAAETIRQDAARDAQIASSVRAEREKQRVTAERLAAASAKKAKLVEKAAHAAIEDNMQVLECKTDLRTASDPDACPGHVR